MTSEVRCCAGEMNGWRIPEHNTGESAVLVRNVRRLGMLVANIEVATLGCSEDSTGRVVHAVIGETLTFTPAEWDAFLKGVKAEQFDDLTKTS